MCKVDFDCKFICRMEVCRLIMGKSGSILSYKDLVWECDSEKL